MSDVAGIVAPPNAGVEWLEANQRHLSGALARVRRLIKAYGSSAPDSWNPSHHHVSAYLVGSEVGGAPMALDRVVSLFHLSEFERDLLLLVAGTDLDSSMSALCAEAHRDPRRGFATFSLALAALPGAHWSALSPSAPLRLWKLIGTDTGQPLTTSALRVDERILHYLTGVDAADAHLSGIVAPVPAPERLATTHAVIVEQIVAVWKRWTPNNRFPVIQLRGVGTTMKRPIAAAACASAGLGLCVVSADALPSAPHDMEAFARFWARESALTGRALLIECSDFDSADPARSSALARFVDHTTNALLLISLREPRRLGSRASVGVEVGGLTSAEQRGVWREALGPAEASLNGHVDQLVAQFDLTRELIQDAAADALAKQSAGAGDAPGRELERALWDACRDHARPRLEDLAQRIQSSATWEQLVLPEAQLQILRDVAAHVRHRSTVYGAWGFGESGGRGLGISALFAGTSGTGKTMAAEVIANDLRLDLYRVDLSAVVSKYIGETEKNLRLIFDAAEQGGAVLLFDEADALFGKRSDVKDSHDRYANIEVSYLLQRMESYKGLAILTTNMRSALDTAFLRRLRFVVQFPFPDAAHRAMIWDRVFPGGTPLEGVDPRALSSLNVSGGNIRSIALNAAFLAADEGGPVRMMHLLRAARSEYGKLEKPLTDSEVRDWIS